MKVAELGFKLIEDVERTTSKVGLKIATRISVRDSAAIALIEVPCDLLFLSLSAVCDVAFYVGTMHRCVELTGCRKIGQVGIMHRRLLVQRGWTPFGR